jgi:hypothetical protein
VEVEVAQEPQVLLGLRDREVLEAEAVVKIERVHLQVLLVKVMMVEMEYWTVIKTMEVVEAEQEEQVKMLVLLE